MTDSLVESARLSGMRLHLVRGSLTALESDLEASLTPVLGPRAGGLVDEPTAVLADMRRVLAQYHQTGWGARTSVALGPTTTTFDDLDYMSRVARLAQEFGAGLHIHFHPRPDERALCARQFGKTPIDVLASTGWVRPGTWFAHCTRLDAQDLRVMADNGVAMAHCPRMIARLGARTIPLHDLHAAGIAIGIGVDGGASNDSGSMLGEMRLALLLHRLAGGEGDVPPERWFDPSDILNMSTRTPAKILGRDDIGHIAVGACADITAFDMTGVGFAGARTDLLAGLLLAGDDTRAALTMIGGVVRVRSDGKLVGEDERALRRAVDDATARLLAQAQAITGIDYARFQ